MIPRKCTVCKHWWFIGYSGPDGNTRSPDDPLGKCKLLINTNPGRRTVPHNGGIRPTFCPLKGEREQLKTVKSDLIKLAAKLARREPFPDPQGVLDSLPPRTPQKARDIIFVELTKVERISADLSWDLKNIIDRIPK